MKLSLMFYPNKAKVTTSKVFACLSINNAKITFDPNTLWLRV
jgi:hypothetical protein